MLKPALFLLTAASLAGCGTVIDFGPEPGTPGDESYMHYQPELHGPGAPPRPAAKSDLPAPSPAPAPAAPATAAQPVLPPPPAAGAAPAAPTSEAMFNDAIERAIAAGDIARALRLLEEAERLGSRTARPTFLNALGGRED
jgi:hypothetical protein